ncbi:hypothetical protein ES702_07649 [subsurface metagenome]
MKSQSISKVKLGGRPKVVKKSKGLPQILVDISENIDQLITIDIPLRGAIDILYRAAREKISIPLTLAVAQALANNIKAKDIIFIATGWPDRPQVSLQVGETDGPLGAAVLSRALHQAFNAVPFIFIEQQLVAAMAKVTQAAGFKVLTPAEAIKAVNSKAPIHAASVLSFPTDVNEAARTSSELIQKYKPSAVICIEKAGMNSQGYIHSIRGEEKTKYIAKIDLLVREANRSGIITIGIGDGGNEIGMGIIREKIRPLLPFGNKCHCPCGEGIVSVTKTDFLVTATVSNWGAYGIVASLAILLGSPEVFHNGEIECRVIQGCADAGLIDGISGYVGESVDGLPKKIHMAIVDLLTEMIKKGLEMVERVGRNDG